MTQHVKLLGALLLLAACGGSSTKPAAVPPDPSGWRCYTRDPAQPALPQGDVTHTRSRYVDGHLEIESVNNQGIGGATRLVFKAAGDHLEAQIRGVPIKVTLDTPDGTNWTLSYSDPRTGLSFQEKSAVADGVLTVTSTDPSAEGSAQVTAVRYLPASCSVVVAELAKYPPPAP